MPVKQPISGIENIPTSIFLDRSISVLEAIAKYLKEEKNLTYHQIAVLLNRDDRTIWTCYNRAIRKVGKNDK
tara:strand:- start:730 stop:945 length:216 start_codon:yes stop_codon:yes gene_type:complete